MNKKRLKTEEEINPYEVDKLSKIPSIIIIIVLKYWAAAAAVFFIVIGGLDIGLDFSSIDSDNVYQQLSLSFKMIVAIAFGMAVLFNYAVKPLSSLMHNRRNNTRKYNMINTKGFLGLILYCVYMFVVSFILFFVMSYLGAKGWVLNLFGSTDGYGIEPFTYGFWFLIVDGIFVIAKYIIWNIYQRIKYKRQLQRS